MIPDVASVRLHEIELAHPEWQLLQEQGEEFISRVTVRWGDETQYTADTLQSLSGPKLAFLLATEKKERGGLLSSWRQLVQKQCAKAGPVLLRLEKGGLLVPDVLRSTLNGLTTRASKSVLRKRTWFIVGRILDEADDAVFAGLCTEAAEWLRREAHELPADREKLFLQLWDRLYPLAMKVPADQSMDPVTQAINHPAGHLAEALLDCLWARHPTIDSALPTDLVPRFSNMADGDTDGHLQSRILLVSRLYWIHWTDPAWAGQHLIPKLSFDASPEAAALWRGYLWSPQIGPNLMATLRKALIEAISHRAQLGDARRNLIRLFSFGCVEIPGSVPDGDVRHVLQMIDGEDLSEVASVLAEILEGAGKDAPIAWRARIRPWLERVWPTDISKQEPGVSRDLAVVAIRAGQAFSDAVEYLSKFMMRARDTMHVQHLLIGTEQPSKFPTSTVVLLKHLVDVESRPVHYGAHNGLQDVLECALRAYPELATSPDYQQLLDYARRYGQ